MRLFAVIFSGMKMYPLPTFSLRTHTSLVSLSLIFLVILLGFRAHTIARQQLNETTTLVNFDLKAQGLLARMDSILTSRAQADRKFNITGDEAYSTLRANYDDLFAETRSIFDQTLSAAYPELAPKVGSLKNRLEVAKAKEALVSFHEQRLRQAQAAAGGLLKLIVVAVLMSAAITAWLVYLFYIGLLEPLRKLRAATQRVGSGDFSCRLPIDRGVTELRSLARSFNGMAMQLQSLDQAKSDFLSTLSHEIKNPLAALKEGLTVLSEGEDRLPPASRQKTLSACLIASKRLETMMNNLLSLARGEKKLFDFDLSLKNLSAVIQTAIEEVRPIAERKKISFSVGVAPQLHANINWDGMVQVFENLLLNAIKYSREQSIIEVTAKQADSPSRQIQIDVVNHGKAIPHAETSRIFERFYRGSNVGQQQGLGIGLHVVKKIMEAHQGGVSASSDPDGKTHLHLWLAATEGV